jgi:hypothetical protein
LDKHICSLAWGPANRNRPIAVLRRNSLRVTEGLLGYTLVEWKGIFENAIEVLQCGPVAHKEWKAAKVRQA